MVVSLVQPRSVTAPLPGRPGRCGLDKYPPTSALFDTPLTCGVSGF